MNGRRRRAISLIRASVALIAVGIATYWLLSAQQITPTTRPSVPTTRPSVPVSIAVATRQNVSVHLTGLGVVQASLTVGIRPQVDGILQDVLFTEGQDVKRGDVLAMIDPRLFKAALDQARGKKARGWKRGHSTLFLSREALGVGWRCLDVGLSFACVTSTLDYTVAGRWWWG